MSSIKEAIILAGGLGTRLRDAVPDLPKVMAPVAGKPFLYYIIEHLRSQGIRKFFFALGYKHELIEEWLSIYFPGLSYQCTIEEVPLGTGGAIRLAAAKASEENVLVVNGDSFFKIDIDQLAAFHTTTKATTTLALKPMNEFDRYGAVELNTDSSVKHFEEKKYCEKGLINGGIYILNLPTFLHQNGPSAFSFEKEW